MKINRLNLVNFRSYKKYQIDFSDITIFIGQNGVGKTNVLEAVWLLADGRSWRTAHDNETIFWDEDFAKVNASIVSKNGDIDLELLLQKQASKNYPQPKMLKINGVKNRLIDLLGQMPAVLFSPETMQMVGGAPSLRRKFLDIMLSQTDHKYVLDLLEYQKVIRARNKLLFLIKQGKAKTDELDFWDEKFITLSTYLIKKRREAIKFFDALLTSNYQAISGTKEKLSIKYLGSLDDDKIGEHLMGLREREIEQALTIAGPHRDDIAFYLDGKDIATFGSRGEYRSVVLALKTAELKYLEHIMKETPILLLDDIFSELDAKRRLHLAKIVSSQQTIITTTDLDHLPRGKAGIEKGLREKAKIVELK